mmetsp:Transcript_96305/g.296961  ORF Transcript_96305/g.296961 Transcript_96305/m.296961 type:complete len:178 (+) Transcript_96305:243-776(+)
MDHLQKRPRCRGQGARILRCCTASARPRMSTRSTRWQEKNPSRQTAGGRLQDPGRGRDGGNLWWGPDYRLRSHAAPAKFARTKFCWPALRLPTWVVSLERATERASPRRAVHTFAESQLRVQPRAQASCCSSERLPTATAENAHCHSLKLGTRDKREARRASLTLEKTIATTSMRST